MPDPVLLTMLVIAIVSAYALGRRDGRAAFSRDLLEFREQHVAIAHVGCIPCDLARLQHLMAEEGYEITEEDVDSGEATPKIQEVLNRLGPAEFMRRCGG